MVVWLVVRSFGWLLRLIVRVSLLIGCSAGRAVGMSIISAADHDVVGSIGNHVIFERASMRGSISQIAGRLFVICEDHAIQSRVLEVSMQGRREISRYGSGNLIHHTRPIRFRVYSYSLSAVACTLLGLSCRHGFRLSHPSVLSRTKVHNSD